MSATISLVLLVLSCLGARYAEARHHAEPHLDNAIDAKSTAEVDREHKLMIECQHPDYRTYIKCLKREKRQHNDGNADNHRSCLDMCLDRNCTHYECTHQCYTHCKKRIIEVSSKTVETTYDCANGDCHSNVPNITTNIHIQNIPPNITLSCDKSTSGGNTGNGGNGGSGGNGGNGGTDTTVGNGTTGGTGTTSGTNGKIDINNVINNNFLQQPTPAICPCPGCYCYQWQPQITIGIGLGPPGPMGGGCTYSSWPCLQKNAADCSMCNNPFLRYQCSPTCVAVQSHNSTTVASSRQGVDTAGRQHNGNNFRNGN